MTNITIPELLPACHAPAGEVSADSDTATSLNLGRHSFEGAGLLWKAEDFAEALMDCGHKVILR